MVSITNYAQITNSRRVLYKKLYGKSDVDCINKPSIEDLREALKLLDNKDSKPSLNHPKLKIIQEMMKRIKRTGDKCKGSVFDREACRSKILAIITDMGLPHLFITLNPSDINNPIVSYWNSMSTDEAFDLDNVLPETFPDSDKRAQMVAEDPVIAAQFFNHFVESFLSSFLGFNPSVTSSSTSSDSDSPDLSGPLLNKTIFSGDHARGLKAFFGTVETQGRGD